MLTRDQIEKTEQVRNAPRRRVNKTAEAIQLDKAACDEQLEDWQLWRGAVLPDSPLWTDQFRERVRSGEREAIKDAILYLEVDPWYDGSGYLKERLISGLKHAPLNEHDKERIRVVILSVAHGRYRREFRDYCRLAAIVDSDSFREAVEQEVEHGKDCVKFAYLLDYLRKHNREVENC